MRKTDFDNKLTSFNRKITLNKTKYLKVQKKLNSLITKGYNFFLGRICCTSNDVSRNTFIYQPTLDTLESKNFKGVDYVFSWKSKGVYNSKLKPLQNKRFLVFFFTFLINIKLKRSVTESDDHLSLRYVPNEYKTKQMCDKAVDDCLAALNLFLIGFLQVR